MKAQQHVEVTLTIELSADDIRLLMAELRSIETPALVSLRSMIMAPTDVETPIQLTADMIVKSKNGDTTIIPRNLPFDDDYGQALVAEAERKREPTPEQVAEAELMRQRYPDAIGAASEL